MQRSLVTLGVVPAMPLKHLEESMKKHSVIWEKGPGFEARASGKKKMVDSAELIIVCIRRKISALFCSHPSLFPGSALLAFDKCSSSISCWQMKEMQNDFFLFTSDSIFPMDWYLPPCPLSWYTNGLIFGFFKLSLTTYQFSHQWGIK